MSKYFCILLILVITVLHSVAQTSTLDSLQSELTYAETDQEKVVLLNEIAFANISIDPTLSKDDVIKAYQLADQIDYEPGRARALAVMGSVYWAFGNYEQSLSHYLEALQAYVALSDENGQADCLNNIGEVHKKLGDYDNSLNYLTQALVLKDKLEGKGNTPLSYYNLGELYTFMKEFKKAEEFYSLALESSKRKNNQRVLAYANDGMGTLKLAQKKYIPAIDYFREAIELRRETNDIRGMAYSYFNLGRTYFHLENVELAANYYKKAMAAAYESSAVDVRLNLYKAMSALDSLQNDYQNAYFNYVRYEALKDSVYSDNKASQIARIEAEYENELLRSENEAKSIAVRQRNTLIISVIMLLILTLALAYTFNDQRRNQKKLNEALFAKNAQIEKQNSEIQQQTISLKALNDNLANLNQNLEEKIKQRTEELEIKNKELADYAFIHAHELRAPLSNILGLVQLLQHSSLDEKDKEMVKHLQSASNALDEVIKRIASREPET